LIGLDFVFHGIPVFDMGDKMNCFFD